MVHSVYILSFVFAVCFELLLPTFIEKMRDIFLTYYGRLRCLKTGPVCANLGLMFKQYIFIEVQSYEVLD